LRAGFASQRFRRHCEERSDEAIQNFAAGLDCFASLAMTKQALTTMAARTNAVVPAPQLRAGFASQPAIPAVIASSEASGRHCKERSDEAIQNFAAGLDCFAALAMTNQVTRNDEARSSRLASGK
jgi:hypothetical protein